MSGKKREHQSYEQFLLMQYRQSPEKGSLLELERRVDIVAKHFIEKFSEDPAVLNKLMLSSSQEAFIDFIFLMLREWKRNSAIFRDFANVEHVMEHPNSLLFRLSFKLGGAVLDRDSTFFLDAFLSEVVSSLEKGFVQGYFIDAYGKKKTMEDLGLELTLLQQLIALAKKSTNDTPTPYMEALTCFSVKWNMLDMVPQALEIQGSLDQEILVEPITFHLVPEHSLSILHHLPIPQNVVMESVKITPIGQDFIVSFCTPGTQKSKDSSSLLYTSMKFTFLGIEEVLGERYLIYGNNRRHNTQNMSEK